VHPDDRVRLESIIGGIVAGKPSYKIAFRFTRPDGRQVWLEETSRAEFDAAGRVVRLKGLSIDITERKHAEEHQKLLMAELDHRVKNAIARVAVVVASTRQSSGSLDEFLLNLDGRIQSMAAAHTLLSRSRWQSVSIADLVRSQLAPYATKANSTTRGTDVALTPAAAQAIAMVLHELVTNAAKYGALSQPDGRVSVEWDRGANGDATSLIIVWREIGGPAGATEARSGYGTSLIRELIPHELGGRVDLRFEPEGVCCRIQVPLEDAPERGADRSPGGLLGGHRAQDRQQV
jgi:two-component sensor histidine kinase